MIQWFVTHGDNGPQLEDLHFDVSGGVKSTWNIAIFDLFLDSIQQAYKGDDTRPSNEYFLELLEARYRRLMVVWREAKSRRTEDGGDENSEEVEARIEENGGIRAKKSRQASRRHGVSYKMLSKNTANISIQRYKQRLDTTVKKVNNLECVCAEDNDELLAWKFLNSLLEELGPDGMSSDESTDEHNVRHPGTVCVKVMPWRRDVAHYMDLVDYERNADGKLRDRRGAVPIKRYRNPEYLKSLRSPPLGLPEVIYDREWFEGLGDRDHKFKLAALGGFNWRELHADAKGAARGPV